MRTSIGGTWITGLVVVFMLIFVAFLALSINYTKTFQIKNDILTMLEKQEGFTDGENGSIALINNYLIASGYNVQGKCDTGSYGVTDLNNKSAELVTNDTKNYYYCVTKIDAKSDKYKNKAYYRVNIYFYFNLPVIGNAFKFNIDGSTIDIAIPADKLISISER